MEGEERRLQAAQECVKKNFMLVMQSSGDLQAYAASDAFAGGDNDGDHSGDAAEAEATPPENGFDGTDAERGTKRMRAGDAVIVENGAGGAEADAAADTDAAMKDVRDP